MGTWIHSRKGRITGELVRTDDTWMWVRLTGDHELRYMSEYNRGQIDEDGEVLCLRRELMRVEIPIERHGDTVYALTETGVGPIGALPSLCRCGDPKEAHQPACTAVVVGLHCSCPAFEPRGFPEST